MAIGISAVICLLILILFIVSEAWCEMKEIKAMLSWMIKEIACMQAKIELHENKDEEAEAQQEG